MINDCEFPGCERSGNTTLRHRNRQTVHRYCDKHAKRRLTKPEYTKL